MSRAQQIALLAEYLLATYAPTEPVPDDAHRRPVNVTHIYDIHGALHYLGVLCGFPREIYDESAVETLAKTLFKSPKPRQEGALFYCLEKIEGTPESIFEQQETYYRLWKLRVLEEVLKDAPSA